VAGTTPHATEQRKLLVEIFKAALGLAAGIGATVALALNYRRHRIDESQIHRDDQRLFTEGFGSAAEQLGHAQPAVRLAGVHALARLADDWEEQRQTCIDVLCAYVRLPPTAAQDAPTVIAIQQLAHDKPPHPVTPRAELEVRQTIVRLITDRLRPSLDGIRGSAGKAWSSTSPARSSMAHSTSATRRSLAPAPVTLIKPRTAPPAHAATLTLAPDRPYRDDGLILTADRHVLDDRPLDARQSRPYPDLAHAVSAPLDSSPEEAGTLGAARRAP
jgi:hypothetical protein